MVPGKNRIIKWQLLFFGKNKSGIKKPEPLHFMQRNAQHHAEIVINSFQRTPTFTILFFSFLSLFILFYLFDGVFQLMKSRWFLFILCIQQMSQIPLSTSFGGVFGTMWNEILVDAKHLNIDKIVQEKHLPWAIHESMGCMPIRQHDVPSNCDHRRPMWHRRNLHRRANSRMPMWCYSGNYSIVDKNAVCQPFCFVLMISFVPARIISLQFFCVL